MKPWPPLMECIKELIQNPSYAQAIDHTNTFVIKAVSADRRNEIALHLERRFRDLGPLATWMNEQFQPENRLRQLKRLVERYTGPDFTDFLYHWHQMLDSSLAIPENRPNHILCAFSSVIDNELILSQEETNRFVRFLEEKGVNLPKAEAKQVRNCEGPEDVMAKVFDLFRRPNEGLKPYLENKGVRDLLQEYFDQERVESNRPRCQLGGSSAIQAGTLSNLPGQIVDAIFYYYPATSLGFSDLLPGVNRAELTAEGWKTKLSFDNFDPKHPRRVSYILSIRDRTGSQNSRNLVEEVNCCPSCGQEILKKKNDWNNYPYIPLSGEKIKACGSGRIILGSRRYTSDQRYWQRFELWKCGKRIATIEENEKQRASNSNNPENLEWPSIPLFGWKKRSSNEKAYQFNLARETHLKQIAKTYSLILLDGLKPLVDRQLSVTNRRILRDEVASQIHSLRNYEKKLNIHLEFSASPDQETVEILRMLIGAGVNTLGLNPTELEEITSMGPEDGHSTENSFFHKRVPSRPETLLERYLRGQHLFDCLPELDWLYIHGNEIDIEIHRKTNEEALRENVKAILLAKILVCLQLLKRSHIEWDEVTKEPFTIAEKGFLSLFEFAHDLSRDETRHLDGIQREVKSERIFRKIADDGYYLRPDQTAVIAVPVVWPRITQMATLSGAGDITSGVRAAFAFRGRE